MSNSNTHQPPKWFWVVSSGALIWNLVGVAAYWSQVTMTEADLAALPEAQRVLFETAPAWSTGAFALAVFAGLLGSLALLLRRSVALPVFAVSFVGIIAQMTYNLFFSKALEVYGPGGLAMPVMILVFGVYLLFFTRSSTAKGWIG